MVGGRRDLSPLDGRRRRLGRGLLAAVVLVQQLVQLLGTRQVVGVAVALAGGEGGLGAGGRPGMVTIRFESELASFKENLSQVSSVSLLMTASTALANKGLFELTYAFR